jgi:hypothetical protein
MQFVSSNDTNKQVVEHAITAVREMAGDRDAAIRDAIVVVHDGTPESESMVAGVFNEMVKQVPSVAGVASAMMDSIRGKDHVYVMTAKDGDGKVKSIPLVVIKVFVEPSKPGFVNFSIRMLVSDLLAMFERYGLIDPLGKKHDKAMLSIHAKLKEILVKAGVFETIRKGDKKKD